MGFWGWLSNNWFVLLQSCGIIASILFTGLSIRTDARSRRVQNVIQLSESHRSIWTLIIDRPNLREHFIGENDAEKRLLVVFLIMHLHSSFRAISAGELKAPLQISNDIAEFFKDEFVLGVWRGIVAYQDPDFVSFVESAIAKNHDV